MYFPPFGGPQVAHPQHMYNGMPAPPPMGYPQFPYLDPYGMPAMNMPMMYPGFYPDPYSPSHMGYGRGGGGNHSPNTRRNNRPNNSNSNNMNNYNNNGYGYSGRGDNRNSNNSSYSSRSRDNNNNNNNSPRYNNLRYNNNNRSSSFHSFSTDPEVPKSVNEEFGNENGASEVGDQFVNVVSENTSEKAMNDVSSYNNATTEEGKSETEVENPSDEGSAKDNTDSLARNNNDNNNAMETTHVVCEENLKTESKDPQEDNEEKPKKGHNNPREATEGGRKESYRSRDDRKDSKEYSKDRRRDRGDRDRDRDRNKDRKFNGKDGKSRNDDRKEPKPPSKPQVKLNMEVDFPVLVSLLSCFIFTF
jgi:hypothetical protein